MSKPHNRGYDRYLVLGIGLRSQLLRPLSEWMSERIEEFRIDEYRMAGRTLCLIRRGEVFSGNNVFHAIVHGVELGPSNLLLVHDGPVAIGSSDFADVLESHSIRFRHTLGQYPTADKDGAGSYDSTVCVLSHPPCIVGLAIPSRGVELTIVDLANYGLKTLGEVYALLPHAQQLAIPNRSDTGYDTAHADTNADTLGAWFTSYAGVVAENRLGKVAVTYASQAMNAFHAGRCKHEITRHNDTTTLGFERECYIAGRQEVFYHGHYRGECYFLDVQAMFPALAVATPFPYALELSRHAPSLAEAVELCSAGFACALCRLETDTPAYPLRTGSGVCYPVGRFEAYLCGEELATALASTHVLAVRELYLYRTAPLLTDYCVDLLNARSRYQAMGERLKAKILKTITNGIWGKFGQIGRAWIAERDTVTDQQYGGYVELNPGTGRATHYRSLDWHVYRQVELDYTRHTFVPIAAHATSLGRSLLWKIITVAGLRNVLYTAVDGLIVTADGYRNLSVCLARSANDYGNLRVVESASECNILAPGVYRIGNKTIAGGYQAKLGKVYQGFWTLISGKDVRHNRNSPGTRITHSRWGLSIDSLTRDGKWPTTGRRLDPIRLDQPEPPPGQLFHTGT